MDWISLVIGVLGSLIAAGLVAVLPWSRGWIRSLLSSFGLMRRLNDAGITNFYASRDDFARYRGSGRLIDYLSTADHSVRVVAYWMSHGTEMEGIAEGLANLVRPPKRLHVQVGVVDPTDPAISHLSEYLGMQPQELTLRVRASLAQLHQAREKLSADEKLRFALKVYRATPIASVIILDGERKNVRVQIDLKPYRVSRQNSFAFELTGRGRHLVDICNRSWSKLLDDAVAFEAATHLAGFNVGGIAEDAKQ